MRVEKVVKRMADEESAAPEWWLIRVGIRQ